MLAVHSIYHSWYADLLSALYHHSSYHHEPRRNITLVCPNYVVSYLFSSHTSLFLSIAGHNLGWQVITPNTLDVSVEDALDISTSSHRSILNSHTFGSLQPAALVDHDELMICSNLVPHQPLDRRISHPYRAASPHISMANVSRLRLRRLANHNRSRYSQNVHWSQDAYYLSHNNIRLSPPHTICAAALDLSTYTHWTLSTILIILPHTIHRNHQQFLL